MLLGTYEMRGSATATSNSCAAQAPVVVGGKSVPTVEVDCNFVGPAPGLGRRSLLGLLRHGAPRRLALLTASCPGRKSLMAHCALFQVPVTRPYHIQQA